MKKLFCFTVSFIMLIVCTGVTIVNAFASQPANADAVNAPSENQTVTPLSNGGPDDDFSGSGDAGSGTGIDYSTAISNIKNYCDENFSDYTWNTAKSAKTTEDVSSGEPIEMQGPKFPVHEIETAINNTHTVSSYGGCGPIAMMGVLDYFSRTLSYTSIIEDPTNSEQRVRLAEDVLNNVTTHQISIGGKKNTYTYPSDYVTGFNNLMAEYDIGAHITANYNGSIVGHHKEEYLSIIQEYIQKGIPVTFYTGFNTGKKEFAKHYSNVFAYEIWEGVHKTTGEKTEKCFLKAKLNKNKNEEGYYADSDILNNEICGVIYYNVRYDLEIPINHTTFSNVFVNESGQGFYNNTEISAQINGFDFYTLQTKRLRCGYMDNRYVTLSGSNGGNREAYLEIRTHSNVRKISFDLALWSDNEMFGINTKYNIELQLYRLKDGVVNWNEYKRFYVEDLSTDKTNPSHFDVLVPIDTVRFKLWVMYRGGILDTDKCRVVLDNLSLAFNTEDSPHKHKYNNFDSSEFTHTGTCNCGKVVNANHAIYDTQLSDETKNCIECNKVLNIVDGTTQAMLTIKGSYKTPSGFIILKQSDYNDYHNDTLVFYPPEECPHEHEYVYTQRTRFTHHGSCSCGSVISGRHYTVGANPGRYANCAACNYLIDLWEDFTPGILAKISKVTPNGSYMLSNGIIVLDVRDLEAFLNGTLIFYYPDDLPQTA